MALNLNETATLTLKLNNGDTSKSIDDLNTRAKELQKTIREIEKDGGKGSENWQKYKNELNQVKTATTQLKKEVDVTTLTYGQLNNLIKQLNKDLAGLKPGTEAFITTSKRLGEAEKQFKAVKDEADKIKKSGEDLGQPSLWNKISSGVGTMSKAFQAMMALQVIGFIIDIGKSIFETTAKFEKYGKVLQTALGSEKEAQQSMAALKKLGAETSFSVDELTEGYVKMVNRGLRPSQKEMVALTDLAASQGKSFDQLVEAALDAQTGEFERLKEFGIRASKAGDSMSFAFKDASYQVKQFGNDFQVVDKTNGKTIQTFKSQEEAIQGVMVKLGEMKGVGGQNAEMMKTLDGQTSNLGDNFDALKVEIGEQLRPVFSAILTLMSGGITVISGLVKVIGTLITVVSKYWSTLADFAIGAAGVMQNMGSAIKLYLTGNTEAAGKAWEQTKAAASKVIEGVKTNIKTGAAAVVAIWSDPANTVKAEFAGKQQGAAHGKGLSDEQKKALEKQAKEAEKARKKEEKENQKHLDEVKKANEKALEELAKLEAETHINSIKDEMQREFAKLGAERDAKAEAIQKTLASEKIKNQQIAELDKKLLQDINRVAAEFAEKKRKKAEEEEQKRLETQKHIYELERQAENALLDWRELQAKGNATKLAAIQKERLDKDYQATVNKLNAEEAAEKARANREIADKTQLEAAITAIEAKYNNERVLADMQTCDKKAQLEKELQEKKKGIWTNAGNAFSALLKGDVMAFAEYANKIVEGEKQAWQKRLSENEAKYAAVGQMAMAAAQFLADLEQQKANKAIAEAQRERDEKVRLLNDQIAAEKAAQDAAEAEKQRVTQESNDKIQAIKSQSEQTISSLEAQYRQLSSSEEKKKLTEQLDSYKENADGKSQAAKDTAKEAIEAAQDEAKQSIEAAQQAEKAAIKSANNEKDQKIDAAEATRDAEIEAIKKRADVDSETRKTLIKEAEEKFKKEKQLAEDEAKDKIEKAKDTAKTTIELAKDTAKTKTELAEDLRDAELKAIEAIQKGDEKAAKEILQKAKEDQKEKIRLAKEEAEKKIDEAEREKREKLKKVEQEKQTRIQNQKELNRAIEQENERAKQKEIAAKRDAFRAQQRADIASAGITGALSVLKALASGFWPVNLVFAAMAAVMTGVQIAKIKSQPEPQFRAGGFIPDGPRHGSSYGTGGLAIVNRQSGREVGEMEGGEAIISREQTQANMGLITRMFSNARTPGQRSKPVLDNRAPMMRAGGILDASRWSNPMYLYGGRVSVKRRYDDGGFSDPGVDIYDSNGGGGDGIAEANQAHSEAVEQGKQQLKLLGQIIDAVTDADKNQQKAMGDLSDRMQSSLRSMSLTNAIAMGNLSDTVKTSLKDMSDTNQQAMADLSKNTKNGLDNLATSTKNGLASMTTEVRSLKGSINQVESAVMQTKGAVNQVEGAVWGTNQAGRLDALIWAISSFAG
ncbi:hypothetical protein GCM10028807_17390 [Spirosoma daeguense]